MTDYREGGLDAMYVGAGVLVGALIACILVFA
jgi:hypothetical protein